MVTVGFERKAELLDLVNQMKNTPMSRIEMADYLGLTYKNFGKYLQWLVHHKLVHISGYEWKRYNWVVYYMAGNKPHAKKPKGQTTSETMKKYRNKLRDTLVEKKFEPRPDVASAWMFNKI